MAKTQAKVTADQLEVYPERKDVTAFPERRFIKTNRFLTIIAILNLAMVIAMAGCFTYMVRRLDITVQNRQGIRLYYMDTESKTLRASEYSKIKIPAMDLALEEYLQRYLTERFSAIYESETMKKKWGPTGLVMLSSSEDLQKRFTTEAKTAFNEVFSRQITRDVHIYNLHRVRGSLWTAMIDIFDLPVTSDLSKICDCTDNSPECLTCKFNNKKFHTRRRVWLRANFRGRKTPINPLGINIYSFYTGYLPSDSKTTLWDIPNDLKPKL